MDPTIGAAFAQAALQASQDHAARMARQADYAGQDHRILTAYLMGQASSANVPENVGGLNTASHVPVPQPFVAPGYVAAPQPTAATAGAKS